MVFECFTGNSVSHTYGLPQYDLVINQDCREDNQITLGPYQHIRTIAHGIHRIPLDFYASLRLARIAEAIESDYVYFCL